MKKTLAVVIGPTASGKTSLSIDLAKALNTYVVSADSRQLYKEIPIGTAAPTPEELDQVQHYMIAEKSVREDYSVGDYERDTIRLIENLFEEKSELILCGGSGLYVKAICEGINEFPEVDPMIRSSVRTLYKEEGLSAISEMLEEKDPDYLKTVDLQNHQRVLRALEVCLSTGKPFSSFRNKPLPKRNFEVRYIGICPNREKLYERINTRVDLMFEAGLLEEAKAVYEFRKHNALQTVGYKEIFAHFDGELTLEEAKEAIKQNSRRYAKRQITWFKKLKDVLWLQEPDLDKALEQIKADHPMHNDISKFLQ